MSDIYADLNEALSAQLKKLQEVDTRDAEQLERTIAQTDSVSKLAERIINNNNAKMRAIELFDQLGTVSLADQKRKLLGDGER